MAPRKMFVVALAAALTVFPCFVRIAAAQSAPARLNFFPASMKTSAFVPARAARLDTKAADLEKPRASILMTSLYATTALMQGLDAHSTLKAINAGARERNPLMSFVTSRPPAFIALKAGVAVGLILGGRRLAKHNKLQAALALMAIDATYALIAAHNYRVAARLQR